MRRALVELLRTPVTGQALQLEVFHTRRRAFSKAWTHCKEQCSYRHAFPSEDHLCSICAEEEVVDGRLISVDGTEQYPIIGGIPRLLPQQYLDQVWERHPEWVRTYAREWHSVQSPLSKRKVILQKRTSDRFGKEWRTFDRLLRDFDGIFRDYFDLVNLDELIRSTILDAGCGMGRWAFHMAPKGWRIVAFDLSVAVEPAYRNCYDRGNVEFVQADLFHPPFRPSSFDLVYCLGVLHHLPDPLAGFLSLRRLLVENGQFLVYLYYKLENRPNYFHLFKRLVDQVREVTVRTPTIVSYSVALLVAAVVYLPLVWLGAGIHAIGFKEMAQQVPLYPMYRGKSFRLILNDAVDRLTAPIETRYSRKEILRWFVGSGFEQITFSDSLPYWKAIGRAAIPSTSLSDSTS